MRFAAVQIPAKIGTRALNGEKLDELHSITLIFGQFAVLYAHSPRFLYASICKAACSSNLRRLISLHGEFGTPCCLRVPAAHTLSNLRQTNIVSAVWGGDAPHRHPRHADRMIAPDGVFAAEEPVGRIEQ